MNLTKWQRMGVPIELITPEMAQGFLDASEKHNRSISKATVTRYAAKQERGEWYPFPPLLFNGDGSMIDGSHRCTAIISTGKPQHMAVIRNVPSEVKMILGTDRSRTLQDQFRMYRSKEKYSSERGAYARVCANLMTGRRVQIRDMDDYDMWEEAFTGVKWAVGNVAPHNAVRFAPVGGALAFAYPTSPRIISEFATELITGEGLHKGDPANTIRNLLMVSKKTRDKTISWSHRILNAAFAKVHGVKLSRALGSPAGREFFQKFYENKEKVLLATGPWLS